jgi:N,N'-diacetyllegionaminate synthase
MPTTEQLTVSIGGRRVGAGEPVFVVAEAGVNHDGELATALTLIDAAADSGADAVKFQTFDPDALVTGDSKAMLARLRLGREEHQALIERSAARGIVFLSTPFDVGSAAMLAELGVPAFKVGSGELTSLPFLEFLAGQGLPILLSTGMSDLEEVQAAADVIRAHDAPLILLHCVSSYPAPAQQANLRAIDTLRDAFRVPVGYSDHCLGADVSLAAVARGACILERHLTLDRRRPGADHSMSMEPDDLRDLIERLRTIEQALGDGRKQPQPSEEELRVLARRSIVAARPLAAGDLLTEDALAIKRPGGGLAPARLHSLVGARVARPLALDEQLTEAHLDQPA